MKVFVRGLATQVKVPVALHGIQGRYATALYTASVKSNALDQVQKDLSSLKSLIASNPTFKSFLAVPSSQKDKKSVLNPIIEKYSSTTQNFVNVLIENGRLDSTVKILESFDQLMSAHRKEIHVQVTSATALDSKVLTKIQSSLTSGSLVPSGSKILIENKVDPSIIGGFVVELGDKTIDLSVSSKINKLNRLLNETV